MKYYTTYLKHHGILGQKWGKKNGPPYPLDASDHSASEKKAGWKKSLDKRTTSNKNKSKEEAGSERRSVSQKHKNNLVQKYLDKGYSQGDAERLAKQRMQTEAALAVVATVAVAVVAKKAATRIGEDYVDTVLKKGVSIQNIGADASNTFKDRPFYAAVNKHDKKVYGSLYPAEKQGMEIQRGNYTPVIFNNQIKATKDIKRASVNTTRKIFNEKMKNDSQFRNEVIDTLKKTNYGKDIDKLAATNSKKLYDKFNQALATPEFQSKGLHKKFYSEMEKRGYGAILDLNDMRYSGYKKIAKSPTIIFGESAVEKYSSRKLSDSEISENVTKYMGQYQMKQAAKIYGRYGVALGMAVRASNDAAVKQYLKEHPNSKLSRKEIIKAYNEQKRK